MAVPNGIFIERDILRIFFSMRNANNSSQPNFFDYDLSNKRIVFENKTPLLALGDLGSFDDSGVMPTCILERENTLWMYYIGWNLCKTVPFRNSIGLAFSMDNGLTFRRAFDGPILDRTKSEPYFVASCCVVSHEGIWKMWYLSCVRWKFENNQLKHYYHIKYAESTNGIDWIRGGQIAIDFRYENEYAVSVPRVIFESGIFKMWYSYRGGPVSDKYRIGYAESRNGIDWVRKDEEIIFHPSGDLWDAEMQCYPFLFDYKNDRYMIYNGNGYGKTGLGISKLQNE